MIIDQKGSHTLYSLFLAIIIKNVSSSISHKKNSVTLFLSSTFIDANIKKMQIFHKLKKTLLFKSISRQIAATFVVQHDLSHSIIFIFSFKRGDVYCLSTFHKDEVDFKNYERSHKAR